jgi:peptide/nickel transport system substrate-binding protein
MRSESRHLDQIRTATSEVGNHYIDELVSGGLSRRDFLRRGSVLGLSIPVIGNILVITDTPHHAASAPARPGAAVTSAGGGTLRVAQVTPAGYLDPLRVADQGGLNMLAQTGEFLIFDNNLKLVLEPMLATSWSPNGDGSVWTFRLRTGVTFHNGAPMTATMWSTPFSTWWTRGTARTRWPRLPAFSRRRA